MERKIVVVEFGFLDVTPEQLETKIRERIRGLGDGWQPLTGWCLTPRSNGPSAIVVEKAS